jgi:hypothetical protein
MSQSNTPIPFEAKTIALHDPHTIACGHHHNASSSSSFAFESDTWALAFVVGVVGDMML